MNVIARHPLLWGVGAFLLVLVLVLSLPVFLRQSDALGDAPGTYQLVAVQETLYLVDTRTGQFWTRSVKQPDWKVHPLPPVGHGTTLEDGLEFRLLRLRAQGVAEDNEEVVGIQRALKRLEKNRVK